MTNGKQRPNFYEILELDPSVDEWSFIEKKIREKRQQWARDLTTGVPARARRAALYQSLLPEITEVMSDAEKRRAQAREFNEIRDRGRKEEEEDLERVIDVYRSSKTITDPQFRDLVKRYGEFFTEVEIQKRLRSKGVSIGAPRAKRPARKPKTLDPSRKRSIQENLKAVQKSSLYDYLGLKKQASPKSLHDEAVTRYNHLTKVGLSNPEAQASRNLCGEAMKVFADEENKERYDNTLAFEVLERMDGAIDGAGHDKVITTREMDTLVRQARAMGATAALARDYIEERAQRRGWLIQAADEVESERLLECGFCGTVALRESETLCRECGQPLRIACPRCGRPTPTEHAACTECGTRTGDAALVKLLMEEGRRLVLHHHLREGLEHFERALSYWGGWEEAENAKRDAQRRIQALGEAHAELDRAIGEGRLFEAQAMAGKMAREYGSAQIEAKQAKIEHGVWHADEAFRKAESARKEGDEDRAFILLEEALTAASDHSRAKSVLAAMPPAAPRRVTVDPCPAGFRLTWMAARTAGTIRYRVVRKAGGAPSTDADGTVVAETGATSFDDIDVESGKPWYYAVYSLRGGVPSATAASDGPWLRTSEVLELELLPGPGEVVLSWRPPDGCRKVLVSRRSGSPPDQIDAGTQIATSRTGAHDTGLENGKDYGYLVVAVFDDPLRAGHEVSSDGLRRSARPLAPPAAVEDLRCSRSGKTLAFSWTEVPGATVQIRAASVAPKLQPGRWLVVDQLDRLGKLVPRTSATSAEMALETQGRYFFVPASVKQGIAVVGRAVSVTTIDDVSGLRSQSSGNHIVLTWVWPRGIDEVLVAFSDSGEPRSPTDERSTLRRVTRAEYERAGCLELRNVERKPHYFKVYSRGPGIEAYAGGVAVFESRGQSRNARFRVVLDRGLGPLRIRRVRQASIRVDSRDVDQLRDIVLVVKKGQVPRSPADGAVVDRFSCLRFTDGTASVPVPKEQLGRGRYAKLFFADEGAQPDVRLMPAGKKELELG